MESIIITGPTGAIGLALINKFIKENIRVYAVCRPDSRRIERIPDNELVHVVKCGLSEVKKLPEMIEEQPSVFYHLAWMAPAGEGRNNVDLQWRNIGYALEAVEAAAKLGCRTFIGAGSQAEYGRVEGALKPQTPTFPENGYGIAKLCAGQMTRLRCEQLGIRHIWTRILSVYGPGDGETSMIMSVLRLLLEGKKPLLTKGEQMWDYLYSADAAEALYLLGKSGKDKKVYCIGSGKVRSIKEYVISMRNIVAPEVELGFGEVPYSSRQVMYLCADIADLKADTGFVPKTSFEEGIREILCNQRN